MLEKCLGHLSLYVFSIFIFLPWASELLIGKAEVWGHPCLCGSGQRTPLPALAAMAFKLFSYLWVFSAFYQPLPRQTFRPVQVHHILTFPGFCNSHEFVPAMQILCTPNLCSSNSSSCSKCCLEANSELFAPAPTTTATCLYCLSDLAGQLSLRSTLGCYRNCRCHWEESKGEGRGNKEDIYCTYAHFLWSCQAQTGPYWMVEGSQKWVCRCHFVYSTCQAEIHS